MLYALLSASGLARVKGKKVLPLDQDFVPQDTLYAVVDSFNQMYGHIFRYMVREVGPHRGERAGEVPGRPARVAQAGVRRA